MSAKAALKVLISSRRKTVKDLAFQGKLENISCATYRIRWSCVCRFLIITVPFVAGV